MKVTKAMKMVAAARVKTVVSQLEAARGFRADMGKLLLPEDVNKREKGEQWLLMSLSADRGLCGAVNSAVAREAKRMFNEFAANSQPKVIAVGTKGVGALQRLYEKYMPFAISDQKPGKRMTFKQVSLITELIRNEEWTRADIVYNRYKNAITYYTEAVPLFRLDTKAPIPKNISSFELEGDQDILKNFDEWNMVTQFWYLWAENECVEVSSRVNAMENSNKAAREMADKLNIKANKLRQAKITLEICDIVAGAESAV